MSPAAFHWAKRASYAEIWAHKSNKHLGDLCSLKEISPINYKIHHLLIQWHENSPYPQPECIGIGVANGSSCFQKLPRCDRMS